MAQMTLRERYMVHDLSAVFTNKSGRQQVAIASSVVKYSKTMIKHTVFEVRIADLGTKQYTRNRVFKTVQACVDFMSTLALDESWVISEYYFDYSPDTWQHTMLKKYWS